MGDHLDAAPARLARTDRDRQARRSYATAVKGMSLAGVEPTGLVLQADPELPRLSRQILRNIPLDLPIDELVTWNQLTGDRRLARPWPSDERGWVALPLTAREPCRLFPQL